MFNCHPTLLQINFLGQERDRISQTSFIFSLTSPDSFPGVYTKVVGSTRDKSSLFGFSPIVESQPSPRPGKSSFLPTRNRSTQKTGNRSSARDVPFPTPRTQPLNDHSRVSQGSIGVILFFLGGLSSYPFTTRIRNPPHLLNLNLHWDTGYVYRRRMGTLWTYLVTIDFLRVPLTQ